MLQFVLKTTGQKQYVIAIATYSQLTMQLSFSISCSVYIAQLLYVTMLHPFDLCIAIGYICSYQPLFILVTLVYLLANFKTITSIIIMLQLHTYQISAQHIQYVTTFYARNGILQLATQLHIRGYTYNFEGCYH